MYFIIGLLRVSGDEKTT